MNLEQAASKKNQIVPNDELLMDDFDFKPITSGLGFHQPRPADIKPVFTEKTISAPIQTPATILNTPKKEMNVYQNDLSLFYGQPAAAQRETTAPQIEEKTYHKAGKLQRIGAYLLDMMLIMSILSLVLTMMASSIDLDLYDAWMNYPHEITPLVATLFTGFYLIYFSVFEKSSGSTLGKNLFGLRVVSSSNEPLGFIPLILRSLITLLNFFTLGLFSYFDLQNKVTSAKVIRND